ncbi:hypothetical protein GCM10011386_46180 [Parapedobacter defluvii]|uniref:DUF4294 domain-containing protein n=1 Tax=Parapedobacter defluvii TaxID=2045106 RepID=A0ABQ1N4B7_9SPHI|nr:DUF4294 domain-containing protein [Parapedobacter defluvii]GGC48705.1 hypothetical protein GCM10011386_46180 [Parapedobacter defluvii]
MTRVTVLIFFVMVFLAGVAKAQDTLSRSSYPNRASYRMVPTTVVDGELLPWMLIPEVEVTRKRVFRSPEDKARYLRLRYNVIKVLPYANYAQRRYEQLYRDLALTGNKREQKRLVKACEKEIKDMFNKEVKNLTISQGEILIKLIDRQTGNSSYEVVKELRGGITAFFYQSIAKVFGHNLKNKYNIEDDFEIENIIRSLERPTNRYF